MRTFNEWIEEFERWEDICDMNLTDKQRWALVISTGKEDMKDLVIKQAGVQVRQQVFIQAVQHQPAVPAGANGNPPAQQEVPEVIGQEALVPTTWKTGLTLCRRAISKYSNQISARHTLFAKMPASNYSDWRKWTTELLDQANRCQWDGYNAEKAALDVLLYQCPDAGWRTKILGGIQDFHTAVDWGLTQLRAKQTGDEIQSKGTPQTNDPLTVDRLNEKKKWDCWNCTTSHERNAKCPGRGKFCSDCGEGNHLPGAQRCNGKKKPQPPGPNRNGNGGRPPRGGGRPPRGGGQSRGRTKNDDSSKMWYKDKKGNWKELEVKYMNKGEENDEDSDVEWDLDRVKCENVSRVGNQGDKARVGITPLENAQYRTTIPWTVDSGVKKSLLAGKHYAMITEKNPDVKLKHTNVRFRPFSTNETIPLLGRIDVRL